jgi:hypothetical protein
MIVKKANENDRVENEIAEINKQNFDLSPYPLSPGLVVVNAWDNVSTLKEGIGGSKYHSVEPGDYYLEIIYCMSASGTPAELCVYRSETFTILVEDGYGGVVEENSNIQ